jgi:hypothetical protein
MDDLRFSSALSLSLEFTVGRTGAASDLADIGAYLLDNY